jgi:histidinol-phosphate/aromatic aminotransferase/cobyric acid decarboxylase-like protein
MLKNYYDAKKIIDRLFPDENFFTFKYSTIASEKKKMSKELTEIKRINDQAINHGNYIFVNTNEALFMPIINANDSRDLIIKSIFELINYCEM